MKLHRSVRMVLPGIVFALVATACAKSTSSTNSTGSGGGGAATVDSAAVPGVGTVLVNGAGRTLYTLSADQGGKVTCSSSPCTSTWPPLLLSAGAPSAGAGVTSSMLGTVTTPSGQTQVTYNNWPLYTFSGDTGSGQANGQGINSFGGVWHPMSPSGQAVTGSSSSGGGYGGY